MTQDDDTDSAAALPTLTIDWEAYGALLDESDCSEAEARELIETLWSIVIAFVDLGFGIHPAQQACGEDLGKGEGHAPDVVSCLLTTSKNTQEDADAAGHGARDASARSRS